MEKEQKKTLYRIGLPIILGTILLIGVSYAWLTLTLNGTKTNVLKAGTLSLTLTDDATEGINLENTVPMLDEVGVTTSPYSFTLTNNGDIDSGYTIYLDDVTLDINETRLVDTYIKYNLVKDGISKATALLSTTGTNPNRVLDSGTIKPGEVYSYDLRLWIDQDATTAILGQVFKGKIRVEASQTGPKEVTPESCFTFSDGKITDYSSSCTKDVVIPRTINGVQVTTIGNSAFFNNQLTSVTIPNSITTIGAKAFGYNRLTNITIPNSVTTIGNEAFYNNQLPDSQAFIYARNSDGTEDKTTIIGYGGAKIDNVIIPEGVTTIGDHAFYGNQLTSVTIPNSVTTIGEDAFGYNQLTNITIPNNVTSIESGAFFNNQLTSVTIPNSITTIGAKAFGYNRLTNITIPNSVTTIGNFAFMYNRLTSVTIPDSVTTIEASAFQRNQLTSVTIGNGVTTIGAGAFGDNQLTSVIIQGKSSSDDFASYGYGGKSPFGWADGYSDSNIIWQP